MSRVVIALVVLAMSASGAAAQVLSSATGDVLVNRGNGFAQAVAGQALNSGDRVMIGARGGEATISYGHSCIERVEQGRVVTVRSGDPCNQAEAQPSVEAAGAGGLSPGLVAGGVAAAVGVGAIIYFVTKDDDKKASSP